MEVMVMVWCASHLEKDNIMHAVSYSTKLTLIFSICRQYQMVKKKISDAIKNTCAAQ